MKEHENVAQDDHSYHKCTADAAGLRPELDHLIVMHSIKSPKFYGPTRATRTGRTEALIKVYVRNKEGRQHRAFLRQRTTARRIWCENSREHLLALAVDFAAWVPAEEEWHERIKIHEKGPGTSLTNVECGHGTSNETPDARVPYFGLQKCILAFIMKAHEPDAATGSHSVTPKTFRWSTTHSNIMNTFKKDFPSFTNRNLVYVPKMSAIGFFSEVLPSRQAANLNREGFKNSKKKQFIQKHSIFELELLEPSRSPGNY
ncbi:hypothetical protein B0H17DRAFT_1147971 [Mycena rosella]|uniref:Uncharacterized protein n=1 Tax=Mycena rosella TaxID=1033263 RepID=A0AAD7CHL9_MYCRO|nr:hypothetical protein B0H17DRAFT_1147971 [Mycena rosella]